MASKARELANLGNAYSDGALSNRNMIINGAMQVAQRGTSATGVNSTGYYSVDRFRLRHDLSSTSTVEQSSDAPDGFNNSLKLTTTTAGSIGSTDTLRFDYIIESRDLQRLKFGTSDAATFTISFWVKSSIAGNYSLNVYQFDGAKQVNDTYTINAANTWEHKSITFIGNTSNANANDSSGGFEIAWFMAVGSGIGTGSQLTSWTGYTNANYGVGQDVDISGTLNATFQITGVQLEVGDTATPFEHRSYGQELALCQRYYYRTGGKLYSRFGSGLCYSTTQCAPIMTLPISMRSTPTLSTSGSLAINHSADVVTTVTSLSLASVASDVDTVTFGATVSIGLTTGNFGTLIAAADTSAYLELDAEL